MMSGFKHLKMLYASVVVCQWLNKLTVGNFLWSDVIVFSMKTALFAEPEHVCVPPETVRSMIIDFSLITRVYQMAMFVFSVI